MAWGAWVVARRTGLAALLALAASAPAGDRDPTLWSNGAPDWVTGINAERRLSGVTPVLDRWVVDDVVLPGGGTVTGFEWWTFERPAFDWTELVDLRILAADGIGGGPGTLRWEHLGWGGAVRSTIGTWGSYGVQRYAVSGLNVSVPAGTWWVGLRPVQQESGAASYWATTDDHGSQVYLRGTGWGDGVTWYRGSQILVGQVFDVAFTVFGVAAGGPCPGDVTCDGRVDFEDIDRFVSALGYPGGVGWPHAPCPWLQADCNGDGAVNFDDIDPFVARIGAVCP